MQLINYPFSPGESDEGYFKTRHEDYSAQTHLDALQLQLSTGASPGSEHIIDAVILSIGPSDCKVNGQGAFISRSPVLHHLFPPASEPS